MIEIIENAILEALKENFAEYEIDGFPVDFENYVITSPVGALLLRYENHKNSAQTAMWAVNTDKTYNFTLFAAARYLRKHTEAYGFISLIERVLNGLTILNKRLTVTESNFETDLSGDLWYSFTLQITLPLIDEYKDLSEANEIIEEKI
ncbi:MAG: Gp37 family protein [Candidatus Gastranaerophilaceae bacterium]